MAQRQFFRISDLSGGLNPDQNPVSLADNEATDIRNIRLDKVGSLVSRRGFGQFNAVAATHDILALGRWAPEDAPANAEVLAATAGGELVHLDEVANTVLLTGLNAAARGEFRGVGGRVMYANGVDRPVIYDGTNAHLAGIAAPTVAPTLGVSAGGTLEGIYQYAYTFYDSTTLTESNPSPVATSPDAASQQIDVSDLPAAHARADKINIYRSLAAGSTVLERLAQIDVGTTTYADDGSVGTNFLLPLRYDRDLPLAYEHVAYLKGYMFGSIGNMLYWSRPFWPEEWPAQNFAQVPFEGNDTIMALWAHQDTLVIFGRRNVILMAGAGGNWSLNRADIDTGVVNSHAIAEIDGALVYLDYDGPKTFPQAQPLAPKLTRVFAGMNRTHIEQACLAYVSQERSLWVALPDVTYTIHLPNRAVSKYSLRPRSLLSRGRDGYSLPVYVDHMALRHARYYGTPDDMGEDVNIVWRSKIFQLTNPETIKFFRRLGAFASIGSQGVVTVTISDVGNSHQVTLQATADAEGAEWAAEDDPPGTEPLWDAFNWAAEGLQYFIGALPAQSLIGHTMQVTVSAAAPGTTEIVSPITFEYREAMRFLGQ